MALKKQHFAEGKIRLFDKACIDERGEHWQFRIWLPKENKYAHKSLRTRSEGTAIVKGKAAYLETYAKLQQCKTYFYHRHKAEIEAIQQQMVEAKKNELANALKEVKRLCKKFGFTAGMLKDSLAEGRKKQ